MVESRPKLYVVDAVVEAAENLGEILSGDMIESSAYQVYLA